MGTRSTTDFDRDAGKLVKAYRTSINMNQTELAKLIGVSFQQVQKYELGINRLSFERAYLITNVFKIPLQDLIEMPSNGSGDWETIIIPASVEPEVKSELSELMKNYVQIQSKKLRQAIVSVIEKVNENERDKL